MNKPLYIRDLLKRINKTMVDLFRDELKKYGVTIPQLMVISQIKDEPKTIGQISKAVQLSYSTVSGIIDRLEREKLVERVRDEKDRRVVWIRKTENVAGLLAKVDLISGEWYQRSVDGFTDVELDGIIQSLELLVTKMEEKEKAEEKR
ncbi:MarR family winged helix-turn-helix transcriptional regulator [Brevibacillus sp. TJ4]|uniref:MarR family winged helix-turn-helix transcriptional regulator n=1 Tax=Brevibacillus sp. TJ4 TaxID=3234853 RepID=UPI003B9F40F6